MTQRPGLDPVVVAGLIEEYGEEARSGTYEHRWERDVATWGIAPRRAGQGHHISAA